MRPILLCGLLSLLSAALLAAPSRPTTDAPTWFTVVGDPLDEDSNTVQVNPVTREADPRKMQVRVSRSAPRISWDGVPYRSYVATVLFDCQRHIARYLAIRYHLTATWQGTPHRVVDYAAGPPRLMEFRDMVPNPMARIVAAACPSPTRVPATAS